MNKKVTGLAAAAGEGSELRAIEKNNEKKRKEKQATWFQGSKLMGSMQKQEGSRGWSLGVTDKWVAQCVVELTSSAMVDAVKKGPFSLIIYFPIRHSPARSKNTFNRGTLSVHKDFRRQPTTRASSALRSAAFH